MELVEEKRVRPVTVKPAERSSWTMEGPRLPVPWGVVSLQESEGAREWGTEELTPRTATVLTETIVF